MGGLGRIERGGGPGEATHRPALPIETYPVRGLRAQCREGGVLLPGGGSDGGRSLRLALGSALDAFRADGPRRATFGADLPHQGADALGAGDRGTRAGARDDEAEGIPVPGNGNQRRRQRPAGCGRGHIDLVGDELHLAAERLGPAQGFFSQRGVAPPFVVHGGDRVSHDVCALCQRAVHLDRPRTGQAELIQDADDVAALGAHIGEPIDKCLEDTGRIHLELLPELLDRSAGELDEALRAVAAAQGGIDGLEAQTDRGGPELRLDAEVTQCRAECDRLPRGDAIGGRGDRHPLRGASDLALGGRERVAGAGDRAREAIDDLGALACHPQYPGERGGGFISAQIGRGGDEARYGGAEPCQILDAPHSELARGLGDAEQLGAGERHGGIEAQIAEPPIEPGDARLGQIGGLLHPD